MSRNENGDFNDTGLTIVEEHRIEIESKDAGVKRHRDLVIIYLAAIVTLMTVPYLGYAALNGEQSIQVWATHLLAVIAGLATGSVWRS